MRPLESRSMQDKTPANRQKGKLPIYVSIISAYPSKTKTKIKKGVLFELLHASELFI